MAPDSAFTALYDEHASRIYTYCLRLTGSRDDAADALQDAFTGLYARLCDGGSIEHPRAYLFAAARHAGLRRLEEAERARPVEAVPEAVAGAEADGERAALIADVRADVRAAEGALPARHREILALREVEELPYAEIAALMGLSENAAAQLAWRARAALRAGLRGKALRSIAPRDQSCERALTLLELREDGSLPAPDDTWLKDHLSVCDRCTASRAAMLELGTTYRAALPLTAAPFIAEKALATATTSSASVTGDPATSPATPTDAASPGAPTGDAATSPATPTDAVSPASPAGEAASPAPTAPTGDAASSASLTAPAGDAASPSSLSRIPAAVAAGVVVALLAVGGWLAGVIPGAGADDPAPAVSAPADRAPASSSPTASSPALRSSSPKAVARKVARTRAKQRRAVVRRRALGKRATAARRDQRSAPEVARSGGAPAEDSSASSRSRRSDRAPRPGQAPPPPPVASVPAVPVARDAEPATPATPAVPATPVPDAPAVPATPAVPAEPACIPKVNQGQGKGGHSC